jgi:hypothetical protein
VIKTRGGLNHGFDGLRDYTEGGIDEWIDFDGWIMDG